MLTITVFSVFCQILLLLSHQQNSAYNEIVVQGLISFLNVFS